MKDLINVQELMDEQSKGTVAAHFLIENYENMKLEAKSEHVIEIEKSANAEKFSYDIGGVKFYTQYVIDKWTVSLYSGMFGTPN